MSPHDAGDGDVGGQRLRENHVGLRRCHPQIHRHSQTLPRQPLRLPHFVVAGAVDVLDLLQQRRSPLVLLQRHVAESIAPDKRPSGLLEAAAVDSEGPGGGRGERLRPPIAAGHLASNCLRLRPQQQHHTESAEEMMQ